MKFLNLDTIELIMHKKRNNVVLGGPRRPLTEDSDIHDTMRDVMRSSVWVGLSDLFSTWALVLKPGRYAYPLPPDFLRMIPNTDLRGGWPVGRIGEPTPDVLAGWLRGQGVGYSPLGWRIRNNVIVFDPTPTVEEIVTIDYITKYPVVAVATVADLDASVPPNVSLTIDAGSNYNDALCIITTTGDVVVYEGNNPSDSTAWQLSIRLRAAPPLSRHGFARVGPDIWMITASGLVSIGDTLRTGVLALVSNLSLPISDRIIKLAASGVGEWQMHVAADGSKVIVNYWLNGSAEQFIFDIQSKAWSTATMPARRWHNLARLTQFTNSKGVLCTLLDADDTSEVKTAVLHTGWFRMPQAGQVAYVKPSFLSKGPVTAKIAVLVDHNESAAEIAERTITVPMSHDDPPDPGGTAMLSDLVAIGATGDVFQFRIEVAAEWLKIVNIRFGVA